MNVMQDQGFRPTIKASLLDLLNGILPVRLPFLPPPFLGPAIAAFLGSMVAWQWPDGCVVFAATLIFGLLNHLFLRWPDKMTLPVLCLCFLFCAGHQLILIRNGQSAQQRLAGGIYEVAAKVYRSSDSTADGWGKILIRLPDNNLVQLTGDVAHLLPGQKVLLDARFSIPQPRRNPGGFDEALYLARNRVFLKAELILDRIEVTDPATDRVQMIVLSVREAIAEAAELILPKKPAALLLGILIGDTSRMEAAERQNFQSAGLSHLMAVSGANVTFILIPAAFLLRRTVRGRRFRSALLIVFLIAFAFLTGWEPSVTRAILMIGLMLTGNLFYKRSDPLNALLFACTAMLLVNPLLVIATSFQLSFLATAGILLFSESLGGWMKRWLFFLPLSLRQLLTINLAVQIAVLPMQLMISGQFSPIGILANLPAMPLAEGATLFGALGILVALPFAGNAPPLLGLICWPVQMLLQALSNLASVFASPIWPRILTGTLSFLLIIAYILFVVGFLTSFQNGRRFHRAAVVFLVALIFLDGIAFVRRPMVELILLDVGQGDCTIIRSRDGIVTLIDAGTESAGLQNVRPALQALGIYSIDQAILTHGHSDHSGGLLKLLSDGVIKRLYVPQQAVQLVKSGEGKAMDGYEADMMIQILTQAASRDIPVQPLRKGDTIPIDQKSVLTVITSLEPDTGEVFESDELTAIAKKRGANAFNLVLRLATADWSILMAGDCDRETEQALLSLQNLDSDLLRVAHHGSATTTAQSLIDAVSPDMALISVGKNDYGHPSQAVLDRFAASQIPVVRTDRQGAVTIRVYPGRYTVSTMIR